MRVRQSAIVAALFMVVLFTACAAVAPGNDPVVVHTQQTLAIGQAVYDTGMAWCTANAGKLSPSGLALANKIRVDFPLAYRALDTALDVYKAGKAGDYDTALKNFTGLVAQLSTIVTLAGGPDLQAAATQKFGGTP